MSLTHAEHTQHYAPHDSAAAIAAALSARGADDAPLTLEALAGLDQFHTGGIAATRALAQRAAITAGDRVLDVGGGLGGPARLLARDFGCDVTVVDLTDAYCRIGELLTARTGLAERVRFQQGDALQLPFADESFDVVWTQHSTMNIADKARLYGEFKRVLRPGGRLALHEVAAGVGGALHFPVPWAHSEMMSFLREPAALHQTVIEAGFDELAWADSSDWSLAWLQERQRAQQAGGATANALGLQLLLGPDAPTMFHNHLRNLHEGRTRIVEGAFVRH